MAELKKEMLKAGTLPEVIIAMVIILIVFSLAMGIYAHVMSNAPSIKQELVKTLINNLIQQSIDQENWSDQELTQDSISLIKTVLPYRGYTDLFQITVTAYDKGQSIGTSKRIIKKTPFHD